MEVLFRTATIDDIAEIIALCNEIFEENTDVEEAKKIFLKTKMDPNQIYFVGIYQNEIVAHVKLTIVPTMYKDMNTYAIINHFCVKSGDRRQKIATHFLKEIEKIALENNCTSIKLWSNNFRQAAHACYYKNGFLLNDAGFFSKNIQGGEIKL